MGDLMLCVGSTAFVMDEAAPSRERQDHDLDQEARERAREAVEYSPRRVFLTLVALSLMLALAAASGLATRVPADSQEAAQTVAPAVSRGR